MYYWAQDSECYHCGELGVVLPVMLFSLIVALLGMIICSIHHNFRIAFKPDATPIATPRTESEVADSTADVHPRALSTEAEFSDLNLRPAPEPSRLLAKYHSFLETISGAVGAWASQQHTDHKLRTVDLGAKQNRAFGTIARRLFPTIATRLKIS
eukprot:3609730-Prymnesium_polylepis.2